MRRAELLKYWIPAILWSAVLLLMSGNAGSSSVTGTWLALVVDPMSPLFEPLHFLIRKTGHVVAYGLLGWLDFRAVRGSRSGWRAAWSVIAVVLAVAIASVDEYHQSFFASRTGVPTDVVIDGCGAALAQLVARSLSLRSGERAARREAASRG